MFIYKEFYQPGFRQISQSNSEPWLWRARPLIFLMLLITIYTTIILVLFLIMAKFNLLYFIPYINLLVFYFSLLT